MINMQFLTNRSLNETDKNSIINQKEIINSIETITSNPNNKRTQKLSNRIRLKRKRSRLKKKDNKGYSVKRCKSGSKGFDWSDVDLQFAVENDEIISSLFSCYNTSEETQDELCTVFPGDINQNMLDSEYALGQLKKNRKLHFLLYSQNTMTSFFNESCVEGEQNSLNVPTSFPEFKSAFKLNSLSRTILQLETSITSSLTFNSDNSYLTNQLLIKREMLRNIIQSNIRLTQEISSNAITALNDSSFRLESVKEKRQVANLLSYKTLYKRLSEGLQDKAESEFSSRINPIRLRQKEIELNSVSECCVCLAYCPYSSSRLAHCYKCKVGVHTNCYGLLYKPIWFRCDVCLFSAQPSTINTISNNLPIQTINCIFCRQSLGALKRIGTKSIFAHVTCVLLSAYAHFSDYTKLDNIVWLNEIKEVILLTNRSKCCICNDSTGELFSCASCGKKYHFFCSFFQGNSMKLDYNCSFVIPSAVKLCIQQCSFDISYDEDKRKKQSRLRLLIYHKIP